MAAVPQRRYVVFDRLTGAVLGTYGVYDAETGEYKAQSLDDVRDRFRETKPAGGLKGAAVEVDVLEMDVSPEEGGQSAGLAGHWVDPKTRRLMPRHDLKLQVERPTIKGDGKDSMEFVITVTDQKGKVVRDFDGELLITTTHGRLSTPGGRVKARGGKAGITLTSTVETIHRVSVSASDPARRCNSGGIIIEFV